MATDALGAEDLRFAVLVKSDRLVSSVGAGDIASSATDTLLAVDLREDHRLAVEVMGKNKVLQFLAHECLEFGNTSLLHVMLQTEDEVVDDAIAVLHDGGTDLHVAAAELDELQRVAPCLDTADTADVDMFLDACVMEDGVAGYLIDVLIAEIPDAPP